MSEREVDGYGLIMPFVTVTSKGGPHDDEAYTAGWAMGTLDRDLSRSIGPVEQDTILTSNLPQADLIAMRYGWNMQTKKTTEPTWTHVTFTRSNTTEETK